MDKKELLKATLAGEDTGRLLGGFWHHFPTASHHGEASVRAHLDFFQAVDADMLKVMNEHMFRFDRPVVDIADWATVKKLPFSRTPYGAHLEEVRAVRKRLPRDVPILATVHGVLVSAYHATEKPGSFSNPDNLVSRHLRQDPEAVAPALEVVTDTLIELCEHLAQEGVDGIYYAAQGGEEYRFSPELFSSHVAPYDKRVIDAVNGLGLMSFLHICKAKVMLPLYGRIKADVVNWAVHDCRYKLADGREIFGDATLLGGFDDRSGVLVEGTREEIEREIDAIVAEAGKRRFILGADCTLPDDVELWRIRAVLEYARRI